MPRLPAKDPTLVQVLSLYLLLLAFFVLLFNASRYDRGKADAVTESLASTFRMHGDPANAPVVRSSDQGQSPGDELILDSFSDLIRTELAVAKIETLRRGRLLRVSFETSHMFAQGRSEIRPERAELLRKLSRLLGKNPAGWRHKAEIFVGSDWITPDQMTRSVPLPIRRAAAISDALMARNAVQGTVSGGVRYANADEITLVYRVDQEIRPEDGVGDPANGGQP